MHTDIQTVRKNRLAERCRGRPHRSAWGRACLDIDASQEPRCRPTPLCRASGRTSSDSTSRNSTTLILNDQRSISLTPSSVILNDSLLDSSLHHDPLHYRECSTKSFSTFHHDIVNDSPLHSAQSITSSRTAPLSSPNYPPPQPNHHGSGIPSSCHHKCPPLRHELDSVPIYVCPTIPSSGADPVPTFAIVGLACLRQKALRSITACPAPLLETPLGGRSLIALRCNE